MIGAGIAGLVAAATLAREGMEVDLFEKHVEPGGRIRRFRKKGFSFDMGPSWYWMPEVIESHFNAFGYSASDFFDLKRLDPSYTVFWKDEEPLKVPADPEGLHDWFESREPGSSRKLKIFLAQAEEKYRIGMKILSSGGERRIGTYLNTSVISGLLRMDLFRSMERHLNRFFSDPAILSLLGFPVLFLGGTTRQIPSLYSLMNHADLQLGSWYPMGGMYKLAEAWQTIAANEGVRFHLGEEVLGLSVEERSIRSMKTSRGIHPVQYLVAAGDYHHIEQNLLPASCRQYGRRYWDSRSLAPSALLFFIGTSRRLPLLTHHNLFFDEDPEEHTHSIYTNPGWPRKPLFYVCCPSKTDPSTAPGGCENLFILIPVAPGLQEDQGRHEYYFSLVIGRLQHHLQTDICSSLVFRRSFGVEDFRLEYHSFRGNAYGLANTLLQTAWLKPSPVNRKVTNMVYAGQMTSPGPGIPPSMISGRTAAGFLLEKHNRLPS